MKKIALVLIMVCALVACKNDDDNNAPPVSVNFNFTHNWDGTAIDNADFANTTFTNAFGTPQKISKLVYLISDITFTDATGTDYDAGDYNLIDAREGTNTVFTPEIEIPAGEYLVSFTFGFDNEDNDKEGGYPDLNSSDGGWGVPSPLGGGYHYMRLEGTFEDTQGATQTYQYHTIRANRHSSLPPGPGTLEETTDTSFVVPLGAITIAEGTSINVAMNIAQWFKNPNVWNLNENSTVMMPKYDLQINMNENGSSSVFSLGSIDTP
jgi:hypothetical protein